MPFEMILQQVEEIDGNINRCNAFDNVLGVISFMQKVFFRISFQTFSIFLCKDLEQNFFGKGLRRMEELSIRLG